jgi:WD40 repeat protein
LAPDGQRVVTASEDQTARLWDALSGEKIGEPMRHQGAVHAAQFSPDGQRVITASEDQTAQLWDASSGKRIGEPMRHQGAVHAAQFSPNGQRVVTASEDRTAQLWDARSGEAVGEPINHESCLDSAQFSPDGQQVITASEDKTARLWDATTGKAIREPMKHDGAVWSAQFSVDGQRVVTASSDGLAQVWDIPTITRKDSADDLNLLADLAEATGGLAFQTLGQTEILNVLTPERAIATREKILAKFVGSSSNLTPLQRLMKWSASEQRSRTISPFSEVTIAEWVENKIKDRILDDLRAAVEIDPINARLAAHFGEALADYAHAKGTDPARAARALAEADFQTRRALDFAPRCDEVKELRAKVAQLLNPPSDPYFPPDERDL